MSREDIIRNSLDIIGPISSSVNDIYRYSFLNIKIELINNYNFYESGCLNIFYKEHRLFLAKIDYGPLSPHRHSISFISSHLPGNAFFTVITYEEGEWEKKLAKCVDKDRIVLSTHSSYKWGRISQKWGPKTPAKKNLWDFLELG